MNVWVAIINVLYFNVESAGVKCGWKFYCWLCSYSCLQHMYISIQHSLIYVFATSTQIFTTKHSLDVGGMDHARAFEL